MRKEKNELLGIIKIPRERTILATKLEIPRGWLSFRILNPDRPIVS